MSPQKEGESLDMYLYRLELTQERQEDDMLKMSSRVDSVEAVAIEARQVATETNSMVQDMPQKIIEAIDARSRARRLDARDWVVVLVGLAGTVTGIAVGVLK